MSKIRVLSDHVANQIAAGEVVERPASVAKELVENSIDALARRVEVDVEAGGRRLLRVADDGCGMTRDDAVLAFARQPGSRPTRARLPDFRRGVPRTLTRSRRRARFGRARARVCFGPARAPHDARRAVPLRQRSLRPRPTRRALTHRGLPLRPPARRLPGCAPLSRSAARRG